MSKKSSIYKFYCLNESTNEFYVSSTTNPTVKKAIHKRNLTEKPNDRLSVLINSHGGWNNWRMECIEELENTSQKEVVERENYWIHYLSPKKKNSCNNQTISFLKNSFKDLNTDDMQKFLKYAIKLYDNATNNTTETIENEDTNTITTIPNTNEIIPLGNENLHEFLSVDEQVDIIKKFYSSIKHMVKNIYAKYPQFRNCKITNLQNNVAYIYDITNKQFDAYNKDVIIGNLIFERINDIRNFLENENVTKKLKNSDIEKINTILEELEENQDNNRYNTLKEEIIYILYNRRN